MTRRLAALAVATLGFAGCTESGPREDSKVLRADERAVVASVTDGDTIRLRDGRRVRLVQIDAPEVNGRAECGGQEAAAALRRELSPGTRVQLEHELTATAVDDFDRLLRYVYVGDTNLNAWMVEHGHAAPYFYDGQRGRFAAQLERSARQARTSKAGFWRHCPNATLNASRGVNTGPLLRAH
ncbi:MAG: Micrococcal nuclease (thermonuclease)-like protein [Thermoleophilia bacterium]|nr:Micrococcal nuclease (thermonuclease)-like protein [Thermoleophilia bacterium]MCZ4495510.1 Micrococcal nuclease (thermonuclease)-like protein [Thermoleophilia bacterium]